MVFSGDAFRLCTVAVRRLGDGSPEPHARHDGNPKRSLTTPIQRTIKKGEPHGPPFLFRYQPGLLARVEILNALSLIEEGIACTICMRLPTIVLAIVPARRNVRRYELSGW